MRKTDGNKIKILFIILFAVLFLVVLVFFALKIYTNNKNTATDPDADNTPEVNIDDGTTSAPVRDDAKIYSVLSDDVLAFEPYQKGAVVLTSTSLIFISSDGSTLAGFSHSYSDPCVSVCGRTCVLYNRGSGSYAVYENEKLVGEEKTDFDVYYAAAGHSGRYVLAVRDNGCTSEIISYRSAADENFRYQFPSDSVTDISCSETGRYICACAVGASNAEAYSGIYVFDRSHPDAPLSETDLAGKTVYDVELISKTKMLAFSDHGATYISTGDNVSSDIVSCSPIELRHSHITLGGLSVFQTAKYNDDNTSSASVINKKGAVIYSLDLNARIYSVASGTSYTAILFKDRAEIYDKKGVKKTEITGISEPSRAFINGSVLYAVSNDGVYRYVF